jgi:hypothetical protein
MRWQQPTQQQQLSRLTTHGSTPLKSVRRPLLPNWHHFWPSFKLAAPAAVLEVVVLAEAVAVALAEVQVLVEAVALVEVAVLVEAVALVAVDLCCLHYPPKDGDWIHPELTNFTAIYLFRF